MGCEVVIQEGAEWSCPDTSDVIVISSESESEEESKRGSAGGLSYTFSKEARDPNNDGLFLTSEYVQFLMNNGMLVQKGNQVHLLPGVCLDDVAAKREQPFVLHKYGLTIQKSDLDRLQGNSWINDNVSYTVGI